MTKGLSIAEAKENLKIHGYNELPAAKSKNVWHIAVEVIKEPMFLLLISCGVLYMILGDYGEGSILLASIMLIIFITFYQYRKTEKALEALRELSSPRALVIRDEKEIRIPGREVVPSDIVLLNEGDRIPADAQILETLHLTVDESLLTGESAAVTKSVQSNTANTAGLVYSGTLVVQGKAVAKVFATGIHTQFGKIGTSLQNIEQSETRLQTEMKVLIRNLFIAGGIISIGVVLAFYFTRGNFLQSLLNGLASAMAILPEEFPVVLTVFMALGAWRLSKKNVLTRNPTAIETLGAATVLCSDKTGTITQNKMEVALLYQAGSLFKKNLFEEKKNELKQLIETAFYASTIDSIDPMEKAIANAYHELFTENIIELKLVKEYPLSKQLFAMTRVLQSNAKTSLHVYCKGAPEAVFGLCKLSADETAKQLAAVQQMAEQGYRVLAVATTTATSTTLPETQEGFNFNYLGLIGFEDPIRPEVPQAIKECKEAGIKVIMITGDFPATAKCISVQAGMDERYELINGDELKNMSDEDLRKRISKVNVFARVVPEQKLRIVQALKANNEIVAMTGDGVNDAPALKAAHIGIAMGNKGTDVAREASSLVLLDDNFASIVGAIRLGRKIFDNLQKAMSYIIAIHIPIIGLALMPAFFTSLPLLLMPLHIVFMELIIDPVCSIAFETEQEEKGIMNRKPRNPADKFFGTRKMLGSIMQGLLLLTMVIAVYFLSIREGHTEGEVRAIAFSSLIIGNIFLILTNLSKTRSVIAVILERNVTVIIITSIATAMLLLIISIPALLKVFSFNFPGYGHFIPSVAGAATMLLVLEIVKFINNRRSKL
ncbi:MAG: cation-translocating P-type ATPase [Bacteroidia bacterium]